MPWIAAAKTMEAIVPDNHPMCARCRQRPAAVGRYWSRHTPAAAGRRQAAQETHRRRCSPQVGEMPTGAGEERDITAARHLEERDGWQA